MHLTTEILAKGVIKMLNICYIDELVGHPILEIYFIFCLNTISGLVRGLRV
jgi:hypothetical protein